MRTGAGTRCSLPPQLPQWQPPSIPRPEGQARRSERELQLSRDFAGAWQTSASSCSARPAGCALAGRRGEAEAYVMGAFGSCLRATGAPPPLPRLRPLGLAPALPPARTRCAAGAARVRTRRSGWRSWRRSGQGLVSGWAEEGRSPGWVPGPGRNRSLFLASHQTVDPVRSQASDLCAALLSETSREYGVCDLVPPLLEMKLAYGVD